MILSEYYTPTSLQTQISELSNPRVEVTSARVANFVTQYFLAFFMEERGVNRYTYQKAEDIYKIVSTSLLQSRCGEDDISENSVDRVCRETNYALSMLIDTAATTAIAKEILTAPMIERSDKQSFVLELGAGSALPLVAGVIRARRQGNSFISAIGVEIDPFVARRAHTLVTSLDIGEVRLWDTMNRDTYTSFPSIPTIVLNENLSTQGTPLYFQDSDTQNEIYEPFLVNLRHLDTRYQSELKNTYHFPRETYVSSRLQSNPLQMPLGLRARHGDHPLWQSIDRLMMAGKYKDLPRIFVEDRVLASLSRQTVPHSILLNTVHVPLGQVGAVYRNTLTANISVRRRWI